MTFKPSVRVIARTVAVDEPEGYVPHKDVYLNDLDELPEMAGRMCYKSWERPRADTATNSGYIKNILTQKHYSVLRHGSVTFEISGVSTAFLGQLSRHKFLDLTVESARFVDKSENDFVIPDAYSMLDDKARTAVDFSISACLETYDLIVEQLQAAGMGRKAARQAARYILPQGISTTLIVTVNMQAWIEFLGKRLSPAADDEIRIVSGLILDELRFISPNVTYWAIPEETDE